MTPAPSCASCRWWERLNAYGWCKRYPPGRDHADESAWPEVGETDHCGEHAAREPAPTWEATWKNKRIEVPKGTRYVYLGRSPDGEPYVMCECEPAHAAGDQADRLEARYRGMAAEPGLGAALSETHEYMKTKAHADTAQPRAAGKRYDPPIGCDHSEWLSVASGNAACLAQDDGWPICTREPSHDGDHAAHSNKHLQVARWPRAARAGTAGERKRYIVTRSEGVDTDRVEVVDVADAMKHGAPALAIVRRLAAWMDGEMLVETHSEILRDAHALAAECEGRDGD